MGDYFFNPATLEIAVGATVVWVNKGAEAHNAIAGDHSFASPTAMGPGESFSYTFTKPGRYDYVCSFHVGDGMLGQIVVK